MDENKPETIHIEKRELFIVSFLVIGVLLLLALVSIRNEQLKTQSNAQTPQEIGVQVLSPLSNTEFSGNTATVDLRTNTPNGVTVLYDSNVSGEAAVLDFMDKNPLIDTGAITNNVQVKGASTDSVKKRVLPANFRQNSVLSRTLNDRMFKDKSEVKHYYYNQKVAGLPVYGATVRFDLVGGDKVVGVDGEYTLGTNATPIKLTDKQATDIAIADAKTELTKSGQSASPVVCNDELPTRQIYNEKLAGFSESDTNNTVLAVTVCDSNDAVFHLFRKSYFVSLESGNILTKYDLVRSALNRKIFNCNAIHCTIDRYGIHAGSNPAVARAEGGAPSSDKDVNTSYDFLGEVYDYFFNNFQRDSYDGRGAIINGFVHAPMHNAFWDGGAMAAGDGYVAKDIWAHELTHAVTSSSSGLGDGQAGALNESISDMFAMGIDTKNWTMGEDTGRIIRDLAHPENAPDPLGIPPDRLFSSHYDCSSRRGEWTNGEPHHNANVSNKAFYLMSDGGTFNGCTINGMGRDRALAIIYKANTTYLHTTSNFLDFNNKVIQACGDIYGASSAECANVTAALQATEMNQQKSGTQAGPTCPGGTKTHQTPVCAGGTAPTNGPAPTNPPAATPVPPRATPIPQQPQGGTTPAATATIVPTPAPGTGTLQFDPPTVQAEVGDTFSVDVNVQVGSEQILGVDALMNYDKNILEVEDISDGTYLSVAKKDFSTPGKIYIGAVVQDAKHPVTGTGTLATITFKVKTYGTSKVTFVCVPGQVNDSNIARNDHDATDIIQCSGNGTAAISAGKGVVLNLALRFQGITGAPARDNGIMTVKVGITGGSLDTPVFQLAQFEGSRDGTFTGKVAFPDVVGGPGYKILLKGPTHIQKKVCHVNPLEQVTGEYRCANSSITLKNGDNDLDFSNIKILVGDVDQNGVVNSFDLAYVRTSIEAPSEANLEKCDVNWDGACNAIDYGLMVAAISVKTDDE